MYNRMYHAMLEGQTDKYEKIKSDMLKSNGNLTEKDVYSGYIKSMAEMHPNVAAIAVSEILGDKNIETIARNTLLKTFSEEDIKAAVEKYKNAIETAARALKQGGTTDVEKFLKASGYSADKINAAVKEVSKTISSYSAKEITDHIDVGDAETVLADVYAAKKSAGKTKKEAIAYVRGLCTDYFKPLYIAANEEHNTSEMRRIERLLTSQTMEKYGIEYTDKQFANWLKVEQKQENEDDWD